MRSLLRWYFHSSLVLRILFGFGLGTVIGIALYELDLRTGSTIVVQITPIISPFGAIFVQMLKMIVIPVVFATLVVGAASLPIRRFGRIGVKVIGWYLLTSLIAALVGVGLALAVDPGAGVELSDWKALVSTLGDETSELAEKGASGAGPTDVLLGMFQNPFAALATGNFLPMIVFAILFGLGIRVCIEAAEVGSGDTGRLQSLIDAFMAARDVLFKIVDWVLEYAPIGVFALSLVNLAVNGVVILGPYLSVILGVFAGIAAMVFIVYPVMVLLVTRVNPFTALWPIHEAMITAFSTRSSAATLPVSLQVAERGLKIREEVASFSLPLGATINMDGVCVHLPMFAVLAANLFGIELSAGALFYLVITTVLAAIGAGGVPGGSLMLLFIILDGLGLPPDQVAVVVALALGINPILDMPETMNNVTGDLVCTWVVARNEGLIDDEARQP